jgi:hypothetical protein|tara:strand:+ start:5338 stop:5763 length:426 start_codon:yes stop_codon:yes gene_type:complete
MSLTKGGLVTEAYELIGVTSALDAGLLSRGVKILERMIGRWGPAFITGYTLAVPPILPLTTDDSTTAQAAEDAVINNLAMALASANGMIAGPKIEADAKEGKDNLVSITPIPTAKNPFMPLGAGNTRYNNYVVYQSEDEVV